MRCVLGAGDTVPNAADKAPDLAELTSWRGTALQSEHTGPGLPLTEVQKWRTQQITGLHPKAVTSHPAAPSGYPSGTITSCCLQVEVPVSFFPSLKAGWSLKSRLGGLEHFAELPAF